MLIRPLLILALLLSSTIPSPAAPKTPMDHVFGCKGKTCVIRENNGGNPKHFIAAAEDALLRGVKTRVDGPCFSGCVIFASYARKKVCITAKARIGLHRGRSGTLYEPLGKVVPPDPKNAKIFDRPPPGYRIEMTRFTPDYGDDIVRWAAIENNKMPFDGLYIMTQQEALHFWKP